MINIVKHTIRKAEFLSVASTFFLLLTLIFFLGLFGDSILMNINCKSVNSVYDIEELSKGINRYIEITHDEIYYTGLMQRNSSKVHYNYICKSFDDGILLIEIPHEQYRTGDFYENRVIKGKLTKFGSGKLIRDELAEDIKNYPDYYPEEFLTKEIAHSVLVMGDSDFSDNNILLWLIFLFFLFTAVLFFSALIKSLIAILFYKKSKAYRDLKNFGYGTLEETETAIINDYGERENNVLFENKKIYVSKKFIIIKSPVSFFKTDDVSFAIGKKSRYMKTEEHNVSINFHGGSSADVKVANHDEMDELVFILRNFQTVTYEEKSTSENIIKDFIIKTSRRVMIFNLILVSVMMFALNFLVKSSDTANLIVYGALCAICLIYGLINSIIHTRAFFDYTKSKYYHELKKLNYETPEEAEAEIIFDYAKNQEGHIFESAQIFISKKFVIFKANIFVKQTESIASVEKFIKQEEGKTEKTKDLKQETYYVKITFCDENNPVYVPIENQTRMEEVTRILQAVLNK